MLGSYCLRGNAMCALGASNLLNNFDAARGQTLAGGGQGAGLLALQDSLALLLGRFAGLRALQHVGRPPRLVLPAAPQHQRIPQDLHICTVSAARLLIRPACSATCSPATRLTCL